MTRYFALIAVAGLVSSTAALAQQAPPTFESLDKNGDGKISVAEASGHDDLFVKFKDLDKNKDGELTKDEFAGYKK